MSDSEGPKPKQKPSWQTQEPSASRSLENEDSDQESNRQSLLENAARFLKDEDIRDAPVERKKFFLGSKGLTDDEIQDLLQDQVVGDEEEQHTPEAAVMEDYGIEKDAQELQALRSPKEEASTQMTLSQSTTPQAMSSAIEQHSSSPPKDAPPIITYPEFLLHSQKPPPLITAQRLLTTLYIASGAAATVYGTSKYIVEPMVDSLTSARQSLAETASKNLDTLNSKLENAVSRLPEISAYPDEEADSDIESISSDPSRFFNRSAGTQTSPQRSHSTSSTISEEHQLTSSSENHNVMLSAIHSKLRDLRPETTASHIDKSISELRKLLDDLPNASTTQQNGKLWEKTKLDEHGKLKAEIRGVKGVLLSARNFPSGVSVR